MVSLEAKRKSKEFLKVEEFSHCFIYPSLDSSKWVEKVLFLKPIFIKSFFIHTHTHTHTHLAVHGKPNLVRDGSGV